MAERLDYYNHPTVLRITSYSSNNNLYVEQIGLTEGDSPLGTGNVLSIPQSQKLNLYEAYIDTINFPDALRYIIESGSGIPNGSYFKDNNNYPLIAFNPDKLKEMDEIGFKSYEYYNNISDESRKKSQKAYKTNLKKASSKEQFEEYLNKGIRVPKPERKTRSVSERE